MSQYVHRDAKTGRMVSAAYAAAHPDTTTREEVNTRPGFDFEAHLNRQREWSADTFGPGPRTLGVVEHIRKELDEIVADPTDVSEWIDVVILGLDGAWRAGFTPAQIIEALQAKQAKNEARTWPDWRGASQDQAIEHDRSGENAQKDDQEQKGDGE